MRSYSPAHVMTVALLAVGLSCGPAELDRNRELWAANGPSSYELTFSWGCFCNPADAGAARVTVHDGVITRATDLQTGLEIDPSSRNLMTIEGLFNYIESGPQQGARMTVSYDPQDGHPLSALFDYQPYGGNADEDLSFTVQDFQSLR